MANPNRRLEHIVVVDWGRGMAAALIAAQFVHLGATVWCRDGGPADPFDSLYPAHPFWRKGQQRATEAQLPALLERADILIVGGEAFPGMPAAPDIDALHRDYPALIILDLAARAGKEERQIDLLAQARSGMCFEQFSDRPMAWTYKAPTYGAIFQGLTASLIALIARLDTGRGQVVGTSLDHGACLTTMPDRLTVERPDDTSRARIPHDVRSLIFRCRDGQFIQFTMQRPGAVARVYRALGIDRAVDPLAAGHKQFLAEPRNFFGDHDLFAAYVARLTRDEVLKAFWDNGVAADAVLEPGECWNDEQTQVNGCIRTGDDGTQWVGPPMRFACADRLPELSRPDPQRGEQPLAGLRIVGLGTFIAGPFAGRVFADLGADVVKVDAPAGDPNLLVYSAWTVCNSGKRSIVVDMKAPGGLELVHRLCAGADIVHYNFRPGVAERLGIDPASLRSRNPGQIVLQTTAYGLSGPKAENPGLDPILQGIAGHEVRAGGAGNDPLWFRTAVVDYATGSLGAVALLIALYRLRGAGEVCDAEVSLLDSAIFMLAEAVRDSDGVIRGAPANAPDLLGGEAHDRIHRTTDGWIAVALRGAAMQARAAPILPRLATLSTAAASQLLEASGIWSEPVRHLTAEAFADEPLARRFSDPHYGECSAVGSLFSLSGEAAPCAGRPPVFGQHGQEILAELGYDEGDVAALVASGAVRG
ncbi:MAG: CoA transferase [Sphingobium sp.]